MTIATRTVTEGLRPAVIDADRFDLMIRAGVLREDERLELRDGVICEMAPQHAPHGYAKADLAFALHEALRRIGSPLRVGIEISARVDDFNMPAPDISLCTPFEEGAIQLANAKLFVEVSDTTLADDRGRKRVLYATAGVPEYWIVDLGARVIHVLAAPVAGDYSVTRAIRFGEPLASLTIDGLIVDTAVLS